MIREIINGLQKKYEKILVKNVLLQELYIDQVKEKGHRLPPLLASSNSMFQLIDPICDKNNKVVDYYYKNVNSNFLKNVGKTREDIINKKGTDVFGFLEDYWYEIIEKVAKTGNSIIYKNYSAALEKYYEIYAWRTNEKLVATFLNDITEQKKQEQLLQQSKEEIQKLKISKERLISIIAHDLRSPFNAILGFSDLLIENLTHEQGLEESLNYSKIIYGKAKETLVLLDNLLDYGNLKSKYVHFNPTKV